MVGAGSRCSDADAPDRVLARANGEKAGQTASHG